VGVADWVHTVGVSNRKKPKREVVARGTHKPSNASQRQDSPCFLRPKRIDSELRTIQECEYPLHDGSCKRQVRAGQTYRPPSHCRSHSREAHGRATHKGDTRHRSAPFRFCFRPFMLEVKQGLAVLRRKQPSKEKPDQTKRSKGQIGNFQRLKLILNVNIPLSPGNSRCYPYRKPPPAVRLRGTRTEHSTNFQNNYQTKYKSMGTRLLLHTAIYQSTFLTHRLTAPVSRTRLHKNPNGPHNSQIKKKLHSRLRKLSPLKQYILQYLSYQLTVLTKFQFWSAIKSAYNFTKKPV